MRRLKGVRRSVALGVWGVFVFLLASATFADAGVSANASRDAASGAVLTFVAEPDALVGDANGVGWRFGFSGDSDDSEQSGRNVATSVRGSAVYSPEKRAVKLDGARFELPTSSQVSPLCEFSSGQ